MTRRSARGSIGLAVGILLATTTLAVAACRGDTATPAPVGLTVLGAASLRDALSAAGTAYRSVIPWVSLTFSFDASSTLRTQIEQGAPADVFASADLANPRALVESGLAAGPMTPFARNRLTIVVPGDNPAGIRDPRDLARAGVRIVGAGEVVPITKYVTACLGNLAALPGYPAGYAAAVEANVVSREDNVRAALTKVELGEADAAIVYVTDASSSGIVAEVAIPPEANVEAVYGAVVVRSSGHIAESDDFVAWLAGPNGAATLAQFGFLPASGE